METAKNRIEKLMKQNRIASQIELLHKVYYGYLQNLEKYKDKELDGYKWAEDYQSNFSNALSGKRPMPPEIIIGLERVLGVSYDYIINGFEEKKGFVPKGLAFAAYNDKDVLYDDLSIDSENSGMKVIERSDEYGKTIVDYIIKYQSIGGLKYLADRFGYKYRPINNCLVADNFHFHSSEKDLILEVLKLIISKKDIDLFNKIFDFDSIFEIEYYPCNQSVYRDKEFVELVMDSKELFDETLKIWDIKFDDMKDCGNPRVRMKANKFLNPMLKIMLEICVDRLDFSKAWKIVSIGKEHNKMQLDFIRENVPGIVDLDENGYILSDWVRIGNMLTFDNIITSELPSNFKDLLGEIRAQMNEVKNLPNIDYRGYLHDRSKVRNGYLYTTFSNNEDEYKMLKYMERVGFSKLPKYYGREDGLDKYDYIEGKHYNLDSEVAADIASYLKEFHKATEEVLGKDKVYVHNGFSNNDVVYDEEDNIKAIVNWRNCYVGNKYDDIANLIYTCTEMRHSYVNKDVVFDFIKRVLTAYGDKYLNKNFSTVMKDYLTALLKGLKKNRVDYDRAYMDISSAITFVNLHEQDLNTL